MCCILEVYKWVTKTGYFNYNPILRLRAQPIYKYNKDMDLSDHHQEEILGTTNID